TLPTRTCARSSRCSSPMPFTTWTRWASSPTSPRTKSSAKPAPRAPITAGGIRSNTSLWFLITSTIRGRDRALYASGEFLP
ncbi:hypothetical protein T492DRAFT_970826, partial [Pavlovales sp. CCMP2436]